MSIANTEYRNKQIEIERLKPARLDQRRISMQKNWMDTSIRLQDFRF